MAVVNPLYHVSDEVIEVMITRTGVKHVGCGSIGNLEVRDAFIVREVMLNEVYGKIVR